MQKHTGVTSSKPLPSSHLLRGAAGRCIGGSSAGRTGKARPPRRRCRYCCQAAAAAGSAAHPKHPQLLVHGKQPLAGALRQAGPGQRPHAPADGHAAEICELWNKCALIRRCFVRTSLPSWRHLGTVESRSPGPGRLAVHRSDTIVSRSNDLNDLNAAMGTAERLQSLKAALQRATCPCVMVIASPAVEAACTQRNGLSLAELLRPFGVIRQLNGSVGGEDSVSYVARDPAHALADTAAQYPTAATAALAAPSPPRPPLFCCPLPTSPRLHVALFPSQCRCAHRRSTRCACTAGGCASIRLTPCSSRHPRLPTLT